MTGFLFISVINMNMSGSLACLGITIPLSISTLNVLIHRPQYQKRYKNIDFETSGVYDDVNVYF